MNEQELNQANPEKLQTPANIEEQAVPAATEETPAEAPEATEQAPDYHSMDKDQLVEALENIVDQSEVGRHKEVQAIKQAFYAIRKRELEEECAEFIEAGNDASTFSSAPDPVEQKCKDLLAAFREKRMAWLTADEERRAENLGLKNKILDMMTSLIDDLDNLHSNTQRFRELETEFKKITEIPAGAVNDVWKRYSLIMDQYYDSRKMSHELRELDFKKNLEAKTELIVKAEALADEPDVITAFKKLQDLHDLWREIGPVAKDLRTDIWNRFKEASTAVNKRHADFFEAKKSEERANEEAKTALCEQMEAIDLDSLTTLQQWNEASRQVLDLQSKWKTIGFASRKANNALFSRFRKANDAFFARKAETFRQVKDEYSANLAAKLALVEKAEKLVEEETDIKKGAETARALMTEWKAIGAVPRKRSDEIWKRFSAACNHFFDARKKATAETRKTEQANLAEKRAVIDALLKLSEEEGADDVRERLRELQERWQNAGHVPFKLKDALYDEYRMLVDKISDLHKIRQTRRRLDAFAGRVEKMEEGGANREQDRLHRVLDAKRAELKTYDNNLGFFKIKSSGGSSMLRDMERNMKRLQDDIAELEKKIELLDRKAD